MSTESAASDLLCLRVANLEFWLDARGSGMRMTAPAGHGKFLRGSGAVDGGVVLRVRNGLLPNTGAWRPLYYPSETWELWHDEAGRFVFVAPRQSPPKRQVVVDAEFTGGEVIGEFGESLSAGQALYPLVDVDIVLFANWLAGFGDLILHAAGVDDGGAGYCFAGASGAGKSTLAAYLASTSSATLLGEDQVILRCVDGRYWIFGTPWHLDPARCSPGGVPLKKLFFLERTAGDGVAPCGRVAGIARLLQTAFVPYYRPMAVSKILDNLAHMAEQVPFYTLGFRLGSDVMELVRQA